MKSLLERGGDQKEQGSVVAAPLAAPGNTLNAKVTSGVVCVRIQSKLSKGFLSFCHLPYVYASIFAFFFYPFASDLSDLIPVAVKI